MDLLNISGGKRNNSRTNNSSHIKEHNHTGEITANNGSDNNSGGTMISSIHNGDISTTLMRT